MKQFVLLGCLVLGLGTGAFLGGCSPAKDKKKNVEQDGRNEQEDALRLAKETLATATQPAHIRSALYQLAPHMTSTDVQSKLTLSPAQMEFLRKQANLTAQELSQVEAASFLPLDAHYVEGCFLFRDAARAVERSNLTPAEQAEQALHWVCRYVFLDGQTGFSWLPPQAIVRRGFGSAHDRGLALLAYLQQLRLPACLLDGPRPLVGVVLPDQKSLTLFDPVLDQVVPGPGGKGSATLEQVRRQPELLEASGIDAGNVGKFKAILNTPLSSLSPRMRVLEEVLQDVDRVVLFVDASELHDRIAESSGLPVQIGNPASTTANSPTRVLSRFLPEAEGGSDSSKQWEIFQALQIPEGSMIVHFRSMKLTSPYLNADAQKMLQTMGAELFKKFVVDAREMLLHGQEPVKRTDRIGRELEQLELITLDEKVFEKELEFWRDKANQAHLVKQSGAAEAGGVWQDQYLLTLLQVEGEQNDPRKHPKTVLTFILFRAAKDLLGQQTAFLQAATSQEKAEKRQTAADHLRAAGLDARDARRRAQAAWSDSRSFWFKYVDRYALNYAGVQNRLDKLGRSLQQFQLDSPHLLLQDYSTSCFTRMHLARALALEGKPAEARAVLDRLAGELKQWQADAELVKDLAQCEKNIRQLPPVFRDFQEHALPAFRPGSRFLTDLQAIVLARLAELPK